MLNRRALLKRGWTPGLIAAVLGAPDEIARHARGYRRWVEHLYAESRVGKGEADPRFVEMLGRRRARAIAAEQRRAEVGARYANWREALPEAARGMFALNRYAKHRGCSEPRKIEIYALKNDWIRALWEHGYCVRSWIHRLALAEQKCRECGGDGGGDGDCGHCGGSGTWRAARTLEFWCFEFAIGGRPYCWHQPRATVEFAPAESLPPQAWEGLSGEKPVALAQRRFGTAMDLVRWVLRMARAAPERAEMASAGFGLARAENSLFPE